MQREAGRRCVRRTAPSSHPAKDIFAIFRTHIGAVNPDAFLRTLLAEDQIAARVRDMAAKISQDYEGKAPILVGILKGSVFFLSDLVRRLTCDHEVDFISISSYGDSVSTSGVVRLLKDLDKDITGRHVLVVEDIIDSGTSLEYIRRNLLSRDPESVAIATLLDKRERREMHVPVQYVGFVIPNEFVVGYGLDYAERYRNLNYVAVLEQEDLMESP
jgi:hypoxanthine phosphoribosyltransferase